MDPGGILVGQKLPQAGGQPEKALRQRQEQRSVKHPNACPCRVSSYGRRDRSQKLRILHGNIDLFTE